MQWMTKYSSLYRGKYTWNKRHIWKQAFKELDISLGLCAFVHLKLQRKTIWLYNDKIKMFDTNELDNQEETKRTKIFSVHEMLNFLAPYQTKTYISKRFGSKLWYIFNQNDIPSTIGMSIKLSCEMLGHLKHLTWSSYLLHSLKF